MILNYKKYGYGVNVHMLQCKFNKLNASKSELKRFISMNFEQHYIPSMHNSGIYWIMRDNPIHGTVIFLQSFNREFCLFSLKEIELVDVPLDDKKCLRLA